MSIDARDLVARIRWWALGPPPTQDKIGPGWYRVYRNENGELLRIEGGGTIVKEYYTVVDPDHFIMLHPRYHLGRSSEVNGKLIGTPGFWSILWYISPEIKKGDVDE